MDSAWPNMLQHTDELACVPSRPLALSPIDGDVSSEGSYAGVPWFHPRFILASGASVVRLFIRSSATDDDSY